ncbi:SUMF1/EgtB/PvdO family nonheme iron enzyme [Limnoglobus roseus]|uniref:Putative serine/threonine protein kinase n=1 Tax=Limnoglobus roseus TaxID=2598579 RepID=A0A5C1ACF0_9BACT|nr:SUMF1/EgtB/PvdO family nonheme iron enzyme [Limnoglobus roseus]QEL14718.1 putative serine/threonine protein kinase [Limnoglobus roseus]
MALLDTLLDAVGQAFCERGRRALAGEIPYGDVMTDVSKVTLDYMRKHGPSEDIQHALEELAAAGDDLYQAHLDKSVERLGRVQNLPFRDALVDYLTHFPTTIRQMFRRPSDPEGRTGGETLAFYKGEQLLSYLPPRRAHYRAGATPPKLDNWRLAELRGLGECSEVWLGIDDSEGAASPAALKFAIDPQTAKRMAASEELFVNVFALNEINGIVPLRSVYLDAELPCLETAFVYGYDLTGLMAEWRWKYDSPKPEAAMKIIRRLAEIVGRAHTRGIVHRDLKPSNVLVHPGDGGKFSLWVTDFGWGQIEAERSLELAKHCETPKCEQLRLAYRGAYTPLYASPQQRQNEPPDPRDDVHALGVIWYQLLKRDPHVASPVGSDWADEFTRHGLTANQAKLLTACVSTRADRRPGDAKALADLLKIEAQTIAQLPSAIDPDGSRSGVLNRQGGGGPKPVVLPGKAIDTDAAAAAATALLGSAGVGGSKFGTRPGLSGINGGSKVNAIAEKTADGHVKLVKNSLGMAFMYIPPGTFQMGAADEEAGRKAHETPLHPVRISHGFYLSLFPVTQGQYEKLKGKNPSFFHKEKGGGGDLPVESVSWHEAEKFCQKLSQLADETLAERAYRLPTEAEWEYACRAGTTTPFWRGTTLIPEDAHFKTGGHGRPNAVGRTPPNPWGLHDMHGNVSEWCGDWYNEYYYFDSTGTDPHGPPRGEKKVVRGGSWADPATDCRSAARKAMAPNHPCNTIGFRVVLVVS